VKNIGWLILAVFAACLTGGLVWSAHHYHDKYLKEQKRADDAEVLAIQYEESIGDMQTRQREMVALDVKYTQELADARHTIDELQRDVVAGTKRLRVNNTCQPVSEASGTSSVDDATSPGLTDAAQRDYFRLRERIEISSKMIAGLQEYIRQQCLE
jgi:prophage endopeptidase